MGIILEKQRSALEGHENFLRNLPSNKPKLESFG
jgi:hypothetical protein